MRKERSFSGGGFDLSSPSHTKKRHGSGMRNNMSSSRLRYAQTAPTNQVADFTIFLIPGLDVKVCAFFIHMLVSNGLVQSNLVNT